MFFVEVFCSFFVQLQESCDTRTSMRWFQFKIIVHHYLQTNEKTKTKNKIKNKKHANRKVRKNEYEMNNDT